VLNSDIECNFQAFDDLLNNKPIKRYEYFHKAIHSSSEGSSGNAILRPC
jgi:hypothetical protein